VLCRISLLSLFPLLVVVATAGAQTPDGAALLEDRCAMCHTPPGVDRAPTLDTLRERSPEAIVNALTTGLMQVEGADMTVANRAAVAAFIAGGDRDAVDSALGAATARPRSVIRSRRRSGRAGVSDQRISGSSRPSTPASPSTL
jgi:mono/diheme cytochrome c family protein